MLARVESMFARTRTTQNLQPTARVACAIVAPQLNNQVIRIKADGLMAQMRNLEFFLILGVHLSQHISVAPKGNRDMMGGVLLACSVELDANIPISVAVVPTLLREPTALVVDNGWAISSLVAALQSVHPCLQVLTVDGEKRKITHPCLRYSRAPLEKVTLEERCGWISSSGTSAN